MVVYLQKESVELAVRLFDQTELRLGSGEGVMRVQEARFEEKKKEERQKKMGKKAAALRQ